MGASKISNPNPTVQALSTGAVLFSIGSMRILSLSNCSTAPTIPSGDRPKTTIGGTATVRHSNANYCIGYVEAKSTGVVEIYKVGSYNTSSGISNLATGDTLNGTLSWSV